MPFNDSAIAKLIATSINQGLEDLRLMRMTSDTDSLADQSSTAAQLMKRLKALNKKIEDTDKYITEFERMIGKTVATHNILATAFRDQRVARLYAAKASGGDSKKIIEQLEKNLQVAKAAYDDLREARSIQAQIKARFGKKETTLQKAMADTVKKAEAAYAKVQAAVAKLAHSQKPIVLSTKRNELLHYVMEYIQEEFEKTVERNPDLKKKKPSIDLKSSTFMMDVVRTKKGSAIIKFARFIPMTNLPTREGKLISTYLVFLVNMIQPAEKNGKLVSERFDPVEMTVSDDIVKPLEITDAHVITREADVKMVFEWICAKKDLIIFGQGVSGSPEKRLEKLRGMGKLKLLEDESVKVEFDGPLVNVILPKSAYRKLTPTGEIDNTTQIKLYPDVSRVAGFDPDDRYGSGGITYIETIKNDDGTVTAIYRVNHARKMDLINPRKLTEDYIDKLAQKEEEKPKGENELSDDKFMEELQKEAERRRQSQIRQELAREDEEERTAAKYRKRDAQEREREAREFADTGDGDDGDDGEEPQQPKPVKKATQKKPAAKPKKK